MLEILTQDTDIEGDKSHNVIVTIKEASEVATITERVCLTDASLVPESQSYQSEAGVLNAQSEGRTKPGYVSEPITQDMLFLRGR